MKIDIKRDAGRAVIDALADSNNPAVVEFREQLEERIGDLRHQQLILTADELDRVAIVVQAVLRDDPFVMAAEHADLLESALPKLRQLAERTRRKETLDAEMRQRARVIR